MPNEIELFVPFVPPLTTKFPIAPALRASDPNVSPPVPPPPNVDCTFPAPAPKVSAPLNACVLPVADCR